MDEPVYAVPAFDANGLPLQGDPGRRRDQLPQRPRRSETSVFAPSPDFTMTTPLNDQAATSQPFTAPHSLEDTIIPAPSAVYEMPIDLELLDHRSFSSGVTLNRYAVGRGN